MNPFFKKSIYGIAIAAIIAGAFQASLACAATLNVMAPPSVAIGQPFRVDVALDTQGDDANAIQGKVVFPPSLFTFQGINDGSSPVSLWIEPPHETSSGTIVFSGIVPGGFSGSANSVVGVMLVPVARGTGVIDVQNVELLRNDGQGSPIAATTAGQTITIGSFVAASSAEPLLSSTVPQKFIPIITQSPDLYNKEYFLVFSTTDKGSGINHYDVLEVPAGAALGKNPQWVTAVSPYLLKDQTLSSDIYVRAVNNQGGFTVVKVSARFPRNITLELALFGSVLFLVLLIVMAALILRRRRGRQRNSSRI